MVGRQELRMPLRIDLREIVELLLARIPLLNLRDEDIHETIAKIEIHLIKLLYLTNHRMRCTSGNLEGHLFLATS